MGPSQAEKPLGVPHFHFFLFSAACIIRKFPGQGSNPSHSSDNANSLIARPPGNFHHFLFVVEKKKKKKKKNNKHHHPFPNSKEQAQAGTDEDNQVTGLPAPPEVIQTVVA